MILKYCFHFDKIKGLQYEKQSTVLYSARIWYTDSSRSGETEK